MREMTSRVFSWVADAVMWVMHCRIGVAIGRFVKYTVLRRPRKTWWGVDLAAGKDRTVFWKPLRNGGCPMSVQGKMVIPAVNVRLGYGPHQFCRRCGRQIHFIKTVKGKLMPCDLELVQGDGRKTLVTHVGQTFAKAVPDVWGYEPHFGSCGRMKKNVEG